jgi:hypothetical protein
MYFGHCRNERKIYLSFLLIVANLVGNKLTLARNTDKVFLKSYTGSEGHSTLTLSLWMHLGFPSVSLVHMQHSVDLLTELCLTQRTKAEVPCQGRSRLNFRDNQFTDLDGGRPPCMLPLAHITRTRTRRWPVYERACCPLAVHLLVFTAMSLVSLAISCSVRKLEHIKVQCSSIRQPVEQHSRNNLSSQISIN